jgi:ParB-like chromosome segregation protein Spo0J
MEAVINTANLANLSAEAWMPERADRIRQAAGWEALPPITLGWNKHDGLVLADGNHRLTVARERGWEKIRCRLVGIGPVKAKALGLI